VESELKAVGRMTSPKLLLALMATAYAAPQINEREVVGEVLASLQPAIQQALASIGSSSLSSTSSSSNFASTPIVGRVTSTSSISRPAPTRRIISAPTGVTRSTSSSQPSVSAVTSSVVSQLQPSIAAAVAEALKASSRPVSRPKVPSKAVEEPNYGPAKYNFGYKVADEDSQAYINHQESREGNDVTGTYNYVNPAGALVTVNYEAGVNGFSQTRDVKQGAVQMRNIPGAWTGPLAGVDEVNSVPATSSSTRGLSSTSSSSAASQEALIAQILSSIQPKITSAVQTAISAPAQNNRRTVVQAPRQAVRVAAPRPIAPRPIAPRPRPGVIAPSRRVATSNSGLSDVFGNGETSVKFATPQFQFEF